jgi:hypothetical protein
MLVCWEQSTLSRNTFSNNIFYGDTIVGGIVHIDLVEQPHPALTRAGWTLRPYFANGLPSLEYPFIAQEYENVILEDWKFTVELKIGTGNHLSSKFQSVHAWDGQTKEWTKAGIDTLEFNCGKLSTKTSIIEL